MRAWLPALAAALIATSAVAGGVEDGNAGLDALNRGDFDTAIQLFTRALRPGELAGDDREFALVNRGKAYAAKGQFAKAVLDFKAALRLKPDDDDAQSGLQAALSGQSGPPPEAAAEPPAGGGGGWGLLSAMADQQYYWYAAPGQDPHESYVRVSWVTPQQALSMEIRTKRDQTMIAEDKLDPTTGEIVYAEVMANVAQYGTIKTTATGLVSTTFVNATPTRMVARRSPDGSIAEVLQTYANGMWVNGATATLSPTTLDELTAQGLIKVKKKR